MLIRYYGHSLFTLETEGGTLIAFDPFDAHVGYPLPKLNPDVVLMSHAHSDHGNRALFENAQTVIDAAGVYPLKSGIEVTGIKAWHDAEQGIKRGPNILFKVQADGLTVAHLGDLGHELDEAQLKALGRVDILFLPVGGFYTIDALTAKKVMEQVSPRITIPMHYKTEVNAEWPIAALDAFTRYFNTIPAAMPILRVTKEDIACAASVCVMERAE
jgi:Predicted Zn-dependent hydrolases of the beta-lactamase fold